MKQILLPPRNTRGDTGVRPLSAIDSAAWIWPVAERLPPARGGTFYRFRRDFVAQGEEPLQIDVSADERFVLLLDGRDVARGPVRGTPERWFFHSYDFGPLPPGVHRIEAVVWQLGDHAPLAQLSLRGGFILKAHGAYDPVLTTGTAEWLAAPLVNTRMTDHDGTGTFGVGDQCTVAGTSFVNEEPDESAFLPAKRIQDSIASSEYGGRTRNWLLFPVTLPDQTHTRVAPGSFQAVTRNGAAVPESELTAPGAAFAVPANTTLDILWDLGDYYCAYPELETSGGCGATVEWGWAESLRGPDGRKGNRDEFAGKTFSGFTDTFLPDGRADALFTTPWWRCGRWCRLRIATAGEPLEVRRLAVAESRYPVEAETRFECSDPSLEAVLRICARGLQMCMHEMLFDCPYYEQQMYPGDTRVQLLVASVFNGDDRLVRHAISLFALSQRDNGMIGMNFPTRGLQESSTYSIIWAFMFRDYLRWHADRNWLRALLPAMRHMLFGVALHENGSGLLEDLPGWSFTDWVDGWKTGVAPNGAAGEGTSALNNLEYLYALQSAAEVEDAMDEPLLAAHWRAKADALARRIVDTYWNDARGMIADNEDATSFSEHAQCLALLCGILDGDRRDRAWNGLTTAPDLHRASVYFSHYLFETYTLFGRSDLLLKRLDLWRDYVRLGLRTPLEAPGEARSDCHAWGSHPIFHLHAGVLGVTPSAPFFGRVRVAPRPAHLKWIRAATPTPHGPVVSDLAFDGEKVAGSVTLPAGLSGEFVWNGAVLPLAPGENRIAR